MQDGVHFTACKIRKFDKLCKNVQTDVPFAKWHERSKCS